MSEFHEFDLSINRVIESTPDKIFRAWTDPELMKEWFCPKPWFVSEARLDVRPGGGNFITMQGPEGQRFDNAGIYLDVVPNELLVMTDAYTVGWVPAEKPFMTGVVRLKDLGNGSTDYTAIARHWNADDKAQHEQMGFYDGWGKATDQLEELLLSLE
jgi:uncharacterized protein YndB with AHSA1/START domain